MFTLFTNPFLNKTEMEKLNIWRVDESFSNWPIFWQIRTCDYLHCVVILGKIPLFLRKLMQTYLQTDLFHRKKFEINGMDQPLIWNAHFGTFFVDDRLLSYF